VETSNIDDGKPPPTLDDMLAGVEAALRVPRPIGELHGAVVYLNHWERTLSFGDVSCSVDHPYLAGTKIRAAALAALGE
jgi:hypothetical protein